MVTLVMVGALLYEINRLTKYFQDKGYPFQIVSPGDILYSRIAVNPFEDIVIGPVETIHYLLSQHNIPIPDNNPYPEELKKFLHRKVSRMTLKDLPYSYHGFVKPVKLKLFDGKVILTDADRRELDRYPADTEIYVSDPVGFVTEWRYYILDGKVTASGHYLGDESIQPDLSVVEDAVKAMRCRCQNYCLDFGVLDTRETALVEFTDVYSIGWYPEEEDMDTYFRLLSNRWKEIVGQRSP